ncbi:MAG: hypothetical protein WBB17_01175 [Saprospiraceae bacterium]|nr:hypothetical protein [Saprospiraceae bacterium]MBK7465808.1 hypothetical protein [Saprospiraceae bacterium]
MQKKVILAFPVQDLTIARYLASAEVDFIGINLDHIEASQRQNLLQDIKSWIFGPQLIGYSKDESIIQSGIERDLLAGYISITNDEKLVIHILDEIIEFKKFDSNDMNSSYVFIEVGHSEAIGIYDFDHLETVLLKLGREM